MITRSAFLPGVIEPVRSAMPATFAPPSVAHARTWREVISPGDGWSPSRSASHASWCLRPRSEPRIACIWVNWSAEAVVATSDDSPIGMPYSSAFTAGAQPWPIWISICGRERHVAAGVADERPLLVGEVRAVDVGRVRVQQVHVAQRGDLHLRVAEAVHRDVDRDVEPELLGELPVVAHDLGLAEVGAAGREAHRDEAVVGGEVLLADPPGVGAVGGQRRCPCSRARTTSPTSDVLPKP